METSKKTDSVISASVFPKSPEKRFPIWSWVDDASLLLALEKVAGVRLEDGVNAEALKMLTRRSVMDKTFFILVCLLCFVDCFPK